jgi:hypothetical protein
VLKDAVDRGTRLNGVFKSIKGEGFCHPGLAIERPGWDGSLKDIEDDFFFLVEDFFARTFDRKSFPVASSPCGFELLAGNFAQVIKNMVTALKASDIKFTGVRDAVVDLKVATERESRQATFKKAMTTNFPIAQIFEDADLRSRTQELKAYTLDGFLRSVQKLKPSQDVVDKDSKTFAAFMDEIILRRVNQNEDILKSGMTKLVLSPGIGLVVFFLYPHYYVWGSGMVGIVGVRHHFNAKKYGGETGSCVAAGAVSATAKDTGEFCLKIYQDSQAVYFALKGCSPEQVDSTVNQVRGQVQMAGNMAQAGAAMQQVAPASK